LENILKDENYLSATQKVGVFNKKQNFFGAALASKFKFLKSNQEEDDT
jgi:hypothetical protein